MASVYGYAPRCPPQKVHDVSCTAPSQAYGDAHPQDCFQVLGWSSNRNVIHRRQRTTGQLFQWTPHAYIGNLLKLHPDFKSWTSEFPVENSKESPVDVNKALGFILTAADEIGVFNSDRQRGDGVYLDNGRIVVHHGASLEVDGDQIRA